MVQELEGVFSVAELMERYSVARRTIYRWINSGKFNGGSGHLQLDDGQYRIYKSAVESFESTKNKVQSPPTAKRKYTRRTEEERQAEMNRPKRKYQRRAS